MEGCFPGCGWDVVGRKVWSQTGLCVTAWTEGGEGRGGRGGGGGEGGGRERGGREGREGGERERERKKKEEMTPTLLIIETEYWK